jgi:NAD(P)-dependent dehydrogenase (short-subunit alcohol dehydrogenase family)
MKLPTVPSFDLSGRKALVTGASSGIGLGCATALASVGAHVTMVARGKDKLAEAVEAIEASGGKAEALVLDINDINTTAETIGKDGPFNILLNSAGTARHSSLTETTLEDYNSVMDLNVRGAYFLIQSVVKGLRDANRTGSLITISSQMGHIGGIDRAVYCASKFAVEGFTKAMAVELAPHQIRINTIAPTFIRTPMTQPTFDNPDRVRWIEEKIKLGRIGEIEDIMGAVLYLASDASSLVTGTSLVVDGGWTAG